MITFMYKSYPCAPKATLLSGFCSMFQMFAVLGAIVLGYLFFVLNANGIGTSLYHHPLALIGAILLLALTAFLYIFVYRKKIPEMAQREADQNIRTKANFAATYCTQYPEAYEELRSINPAFAQKYERNEKGKIVKIKR